ncbi:13624_t:CDS:10 [Funneliformis caledonium]|uniref:Twinfilin n=2 Tax=Funneliformis TaxID=1117308 RepID=A0A9N9FPJ4_9GLOM|nr:5934_t:CDS:10 [Funneliformis mosseae]CAG8552322.1 13624_t:CDS:10 [Funneliformis caledonium]
MSHQSGIRVSQELADVFAKAVSEKNLRLLRISIINESLVPNGTKEIADNWESDFAGVSDFLEEKTPCYILYRLDSKSSTGDYEWIFMTYVPDISKVRDKMLYASTRATLLKELGDSRFVDSVYGTTTAEFSLEGYQKHRRHKEADAPLTEREKELAEVKTAEANANAFSYSTRKSHAAGISFPMSDEAIQAIQGLLQPDLTNNFVKLFLDIKKETIELDETVNINIDNLAKSFPTDSPRYAFYVYQHTHDGVDVISNIFIYTCPPNSKIRERMLYSSCRGSVITFAEKEAGISITKKLETNDPEDFTKSYILDELHPTTETAPMSFSRPKPPGRKGVVRT